MKTSCSTLMVLLAALGVPHALAVTVTTLTDDGPGSLRAAISAGGNIDFAVTGTITLTSGELAINSSLVISGPGAEQLTVQRSAADATPAFRVLRVEGGAVTISGLTIQNGFGTGGDHDGGGILNRGSLALNECIVSGNRSDANGRGAGLYNAYGAVLTVNRCVFANNVTAEGEGGGIYVFGQATINDSTFRENRGAGTYSRGGGLHVDYFGTGHVARCTFSGNSVGGVNAQGGGIYNYGALDIVNSTFSGNRSGGTGGGLHVDALSRGTTIRNCTITGNAATEGAGIFNNGFPPYNTGLTTISDSIVAGNSSAAEDIDNSGIINSGGHNLFGLVAGNSIIAGVGDQFGVGADALRLGPLANNGGPTQTRALLAGSPAIDTGNESVFPDTDQRGVLRPFGPRADIGAFEFDQVLPTNQPPTVSIVTPTNGAIFTAPVTILVFASVHDPDGNAAAATVEFFAGTNKIGNGQLVDPGPLHDAAFRFIWTNVPPGEYNLTARVTDDQGATGTSAPVHIRVQGADTLPVVRIIATDPNAAEPDDPGTFTVSRDGPTNNTLQVYYLIGGSASNGVDYVTLSNRVTVPAGVRSAQISVSPIDDVLTEGVETVELRLELPPIRPPEMYVIGSPSNAVVSIHDNEPPPTNQPPTITIVAPTNGATFTAPANILILASVHDPDGIAWAATVELFDGTNMIGNGQLHDPGPPHDAAFLFYWTNVPPGEYELTAKVTDDHGATAVSPLVHIRVQGPANFPVVTVVATDPTAAEPDNTGTFTIYRSSGTNVLTVYYTLGGTASNGVDYIASPSSPIWPSSYSVVIPAGAESASVTITPRDDNLVEGPETAVLRLAPCPDLLACYAIGSPSNAVVTILDNDPPPDQPVVTIEATDAHASEPGAVTVLDPGMFTVYRAGNTSATLYVHYRIDGTASNGLDYVAISNVVVIPAGERSARILVNPLHDILLEDSETVALRLEDPLCIAIFPPPPDCYRVGTPREATVYIADSDHASTNHPPTVHIFTPINGSSFVAPANILVAAHAEDVDGYLTIQTVEFFAGAHSLGITTNFPTLDPIGPFKLVWTNVPPGNYVLTARATDSDGAFGISPPVEIHLVETNHPPTNVLPVVTIAASDAIAAEGTNCWHWPGWSNSPTGNLCLTNTATFVVRRTGDTNISLSVSYEIGGTATNGVDYTALPGSVTILAGHRAAEIKIVPVDDALPEHIETVVLALIARPAVSNTPVPYIIGRPRRAAAIIVDNDQPRPRTGMLPDHNFHIMRPGDNGTWWRIECSTNLVDWSVLSTNSVTDGAIHFVDPDGDEQPQRFYRAVPELNPPLTE